MAEEKAELAELLGQSGESLVIKGTELQIKPLTLLQISGVLSCIDQLAEKGVVKVEGPDGLFSKDFNISKLALRGGEDFIRILSIAVRQDYAWIGDLDPLETVRIAQTVWRVNADFFDRNRAELVEAVGPLVGAALAGMKNLLTGMLARGPQPSSALSSMATGTSATTH